MRRSFICVAATFIAAFAAGSAVTARAQSPRAGTVIVPPSNVLPPQDRGTHSHTNFLIFQPSKNGKPAGLVGQSPAGETPSSLACVYQVGPSNSTNCPVNYGASMNYDNPNGGSNIIAIVDAYDYPSAMNDFNHFSSVMGLPYGNNCGGVGGKLPCFAKVPASGTTLPRSNSSWAQEEALDIEWAHAMAPYAQIVLVEAASNSNSNLFQAVTVASNIVAACGNNTINANSHVTCPSTGGLGEVSMSWGGSESSSEISYDLNFTSTPGITYFASSGDSGGKVIYPSASPYVVSAGGTTVNRNSSGDFTGETTWSSAGGGPSSYETMPEYQDITADINTTGYRGTPDISFDANPYTGVSVYDSTASQGLSGWLVFGGTSVASPSLAGIVNSAGAFGNTNNTSNTSIQNNLYTNYSTDASSTTDPTKCSYSSSTPFNDITTGSAGTYKAGSCWDFASGIGSLRGLTGPQGTGASPPAGSTTTLAAPTKLVATAGNGVVNLSWTASTGATSYDVFRSTVGGQETSSPAIGSTSTTTYTDSGLSNGTTYYYEVEAVNSSSGVTSGPSNEASATPQAATAPNPPTNLSASSPGKSGKVNLSWTQSTSSNVTQNNIYRAVGAGGTYGLIATVSATTSYSDSSAAKGTNYCYEVTALNSSGQESSRSNSSCATPAVVGK